MNLAKRLLQSSPLLLDGAMGTQLAAAGLEMGGQNSVSHPDEVRAVHRQYSQAGCDILITNTLTMNRIYVETHQVPVDLREVNLAGVRLARAAAQPGQFILGDLCSTGHLLEPYGDYTEEQFENTFREQVEYLLEGGVDGFIIETMMDLRETLCAVRACKAVASALPVMASFAFHSVEQGGRTIMGNSASEIAAAMADAGAAAVGANCGDLDPFETARIVTIMRDAVSLPIIVQPNAGKPKLVGNQTVFDMTAEDFTNGIDECIRQGARLVGGCCGTTPEHIRRVAQHLGKFNEKQR